MRKKAEEASAPPSPDLPYVEGTMLHYAGENGEETVNLAEYDGQQHRVNSYGVLVYELIRPGMGVKNLSVKNIDEAHTLESVCNRYFRGW